MNDELDLTDENQSNTEELELDDVTLMTAEQTSSADLDTEWLRKPPKYKRRELVQDKTGQTYLAVRKLSRKRFRVDNGKRRVRHYCLVEQFLLLDESDIVDQKVAAKTTFTPTEAENEILALARKSAWSVMPQIVAIWLAWLILSILLIRVREAADLMLLPTLGLTLLAAMMCVGISFYPFWVQWAYFYRIGTNERLIEEYRPPFFLTGFEHSALINDTSKGFEPRDVNLLTNMLGRWSFGFIASDTPSQDDEWLKKLSFVKFHEDVADVLNGQRGHHRARDEQDRRLSVKANRAIIDALGTRDDTP